MKKIPWYQKIQIQIPVIVFLIILIPAVAFGSYDISASRRSQLQNAKESAGERLYETSLLMQDVMQEIENAGKSLTDSGTFLNLVRTYQDTPADPQTQSSLLLSLGQTAWPCSYIEQMYLITEDAPYLLSSNPSMKRTETDGAGQILYQTWLNVMRGQTTWALFQDEAGGVSKIAYWRPVQQSDDSPSSLVCVLKDEYLKSLMAGLNSREGSLNVIGSYQGRMLYGDSAFTDWEGSLADHPMCSQAYSRPENSGSYFAEEQGTGWLVTYYNSLEDGWKYISAIPEHRIYTGMADRKFLYILLVSGLSGVLFGSLVLYFLVSRPLGKLQKKMELMERGQLEPLDFTGGNNEIGLVLKAYDHMIVRLKKLIDEVYVQQLLRKQAELSSLQSKMDEHFLYNTLNTIYCKASEEKAAVSASMILKLSQYFRLSLSDGQEKIPLDEILEMIRAYLQIQQMRYGQTLKCKIETFPGMGNYISLKQLYQPIIENAVIHGFEKKPGNHSLYISFCHIDGRLRFAVQDDGIGMSQERCVEVTSEMPAFDPIQGRGYALRNIREQIRIVYGDEYGIKIDSQPGHGTRVVLEVPLERR